MNCSSRRQNWFSGQSPNNKVTLLSLFSISVFAVLFIQGCGYGKVSPKAYEYAKALHSICDRQDETRLEKLAKMLEQSKAKDEISDQEFRWLDDIVAQGRQRQWKRATDNARRMMKDQVQK
ncbi:MAG: hypothetical protein ACFCD0_20685 [Gemmataceae bacterium]